MRLRSILTAASVVALLSGCSSYQPHLLAYSEQVLQAQTGDYFACTATAAASDDPSIFSRDLAECSGEGDQAAAEGLSPGRIAGALADTVVIAAVQAVEDSIAASRGRAEGASTASAAG